MLLKMQSQTRLIQEAQGVGDPRIFLLLLLLLLVLLLRVLIVDVRAEADLGECETRLRTTTTLLPAASTIAASRIPIHRSASSSLLARRSERSRGRRHSTLQCNFFSNSLSTESNNFFSSSVAPVLARRSARSLLGAWPTLVPHFTLQFSAYSERVLRTSSRLPFS